MSQEAPHYIGHRKRLKERFLKAPDALEEYELLELFLFLSLPRTDTKPLAKELLSEFKSLGALLAASPEVLEKIKGMGSHTVYAFKILEAFVGRLLKEKLQSTTLLNSTDAVVRYCKFKMAHLKIEQFRVLFLNTKGALLADEPQQTGTVDHAVIYPREILKRALQLGASSFIMVHNHPSGYTQPSKADKDITQKLKHLGKEMGIRLLDHLIIGKYEWYSFKAHGWLEVS